MRVRTGNYFLIFEIYVAAVFTANLTALVDSFDKGRVMMSMIIVMMSMMLMTNVMMTINQSYHARLRALSILGPPAAISDVIHRRRWYSYRFMCDV